LNAAEVVGGEFVPADEESSDAVEPSRTDFDHPTAWQMALRIAWGRQGLLVRGFRWDVRRVAMFLRLLPARFVVVAAIQAQVRLGRLLCGLRRFCRDIAWFLLHQRGIEQLAQLLPVMAIGSRDHNRQGNTRSVGQQVALGAALASIGGVASRGLRLSLNPFFGRAP